MATAASNSARHACTRAGLATSCTLSLMRRRRLHRRPLQGPGSLRAPLPTPCGQLPYSSSAVTAKRA